MSTILDDICSAKRAEIAAAQACLPEAQLRRMAADAPPARDFAAALRPAVDFLPEPLEPRMGDDREPDEMPAPLRRVRLIAEVKKASPSKGVLRADFDPVAIARDYERAGAACLSVLTDEPFFQGSLENLRRVRAAVRLPLLRKDFILEPYQVVEARAAGADAVLLIAECLDDAALVELHAAILSLGMTPLVELYDAENLPRVLALRPRMVGINNRDLRTFQVDLGRTLELRPRVPADCLVVSESGIATPADVARLAAAGVDAMLVGESLVRQPDVAAAVRALLG